MDSSQLKEHLNKLGKNVSHYCNIAYNKSSNLFNYLNQKFRERFSGYETIDPESEPLLDEESRSDSKYYQYTPDIKTELEDVKLYRTDEDIAKEKKPKTLSNIFRSVTKVFQSYYSDASNSSSSNAPTQLDSSSSDSENNSPVNMTESRKKFFLSMKKSKREAQADSLTEYEDMENSFEEDDEDDEDKEIEELFYSCINTSNTIQISV